MSWTVVNPVTAEPTLAPFADAAALAFTQTLSKRLLSDPASRDYPDLVALGFWLRKSHIEQILQPYHALALRPIGHIFHAAPGNVDSLFVYSGMLSLLCGNRNTIRLSTRMGGSAQLLCNMIRELSADFPTVAARFQLIRCERDAPELKELQARIDARVLWGSNEGIQALRQVPMPAHARELTFAHKLSFCVLGAEALLQANNDALHKLVEGFARDNLTFAQQACSSAKLVVWQGNSEAIHTAATQFWQALAAYVELPSATQLQMTESEQYRSVNNQQNLAMASAVSDIQRFGQFSVAQTDSLSPFFIDGHQGCGLFVQMSVQHVDELSHQLVSAHQTLSYFGVENVQDWAKNQLCGIDRVVPVGQALEFDTLWDGVDLVRAFSRESRW
ncbi:MAG: acyl-CoA reductase [Idiomarina sp.]|nr:acyl-CoA reductase [Idiomarina sp.]